MPDIDMESICITSAILALKHTPAEKILLARICQRAMDNNGTCTDTNKELGEVVFMHPQTVSDLVNRLGQTPWLQIRSEQGEVTQRLLTPHVDLTEGYKQLTYPPHPTTNQTPKPLTYPLASESDASLSQSLTPYPPVTDSQPTGKRLCPVTSVDISRQRNEVVFVTAKTLMILANAQPQFYHSLTNRFLPGEEPDLISPRRDCDRIAKAVRELVVSGKPFEPVIPPNRICSVTGLNVDHQSIHYTHATASTLQNLFKQDRALFDEVAARFLTPDDMNESMSTQIMMLTNRVEQQVRELHSLNQLYSYSAPTLSRTKPDPSQATIPGTSRPIRYCPVTEIEITHQRPDCRFATLLTLQGIDKTWAERLCTRFLTPEQRKEERGYQLYLLAKKVRNAGLKLPKETTSIA